MWHLPPKIMHFCGNVCMCIYAVFVSLEDSVFMGKCVYVVSVSEECAGGNIQYIGHSSRQSCYLRVASVSIGALQYSRKVPAFVSRHG